MLSWGSRDGRKVVGFGVEEEMEETELEEGEASYYQDGDASIDPDVSLSYLDEKLQDVLGHFQKDFEGGVSAENLGAKFGGYGSFLPAYQRSPSILSHPRTPQKVQSYSAPKSPNKLLLEGARPNHATQAGGSHSARFLPASNSLQPGSKVPIVDKSAKRDLGMSTAHGALHFTPKYDSGDKYVNATDLKTLKVRIKVGPDNVFARKNAAIYSGLGLDDSPSSLEDSPDGSGGLSPDVLDAPDESPMTILQIMTAFPVPSGLHSPLLDSLFGLTEKKKPFPADITAWTVRKGLLEIPANTDEPPSVKDMQVFGEKKMKSSEKNGRSMEVKLADNADVEDDKIALLKKEIDVETLIGKELVCNALEIQLPSLPKVTNEKVERQTCDETLKVASRGFDLSRQFIMGVVKDRVLPSDTVKEEPLESIATQDTIRIDNVGNETVTLKGKLNSKTISAEKVWDEKRESSHKEFSFDPTKDGRGEKNYDTSKVGPDGVKARKDHSSGSVEPLRQKATQKSMSYDQDGVNMPLEKLHGSKKKLKGSQSNGTSAMEFPKESLGANSSVASKDKKNTLKRRDQFPENMSDSMKYQKELGKPVSRECNTDSLGDMKAEQVESRTDSVETHFKDKPRDSKLDVEKETHDGKSKERLGSKKVEYPSTSEEYGKAPSVIPFTGNGPTLEAVTAPVASVVIEENWVCCDRCQKWRLLPFGTNPDHLPKKWLCSMLNWLPGMNKCTISEEETTKALNALYQIPVPVSDGQNSLHSQHDGATSGIALTDLRHLDHNHELSSHSMLSGGKKKHGSNGGKKKHGSKDISNALIHVSLTHLPNSSKNSQLGSIKSRSLNDVNHYPLESNPTNKVAFQHTSKSNDFHKHKQKEKHKLADRHSHGGDYIEQSGKRSKTKSKREADKDGFRTSKKIKTEGSHYTVEDLHSDHDVTGNAIPNLSNGFPTKLTGNNPQKHNDYSSSKDSKGETRDNLLVSRNNLKAQVQVSLNGEYNTQFGATDMVKSDKIQFAAKKRKVKEWQESQGYLETLPNSEHLPENGVSVKEEISESGLRKEKKVRVSTSEGKDSSSSKAEGRTDGKGRVTKILLSGSRDSLADGTEKESRRGNEKQHQVGQYRGNSVSQCTPDGVDLLKRDLGYARPSMAATSSSSKVSSSRKSKANFQEVKGSPVESVSSSPLRISNTEKQTTESRKAAETLTFDSMRDPYDCNDRGASQISGSKHKDGVLSKAYVGIQGDPSPSEFEINNVVNGVSDNKEKLNSHYRVNGPYQQKSGKGSSSRSRDKHRSGKSDFDKGKIKLSNSFSEQDGHSSYNEDLKDGNYTFQKKCSTKSEKDEKNYIGKKDFITNGSTEKFGMHESSDVLASSLPNKQQNLPQEAPREGEMLSNRVFTDRTDRTEMVSGKGKLLPSPDKHETQSSCPQEIPVQLKGSRSDIMHVGASNGDVSKQLRKPDNQNGTHHSNLREPTANGIVGKDLDAPSPVRKDSRQVAAANALKEAKDIKHSADRLKNGGLELEGNVLYFQAALKFLHGASLLELCNVESAKHGEMTQSMQVYTDTAKLCEHCAHQFERSKEMAAAALAYKCMEVAYMRVIYSKNSSASKDRHELQAALQVVPPGESPSSSSSDIDNLNNQAALDKVALAKCVNSPQVTGSHIVVARNRPNFVRLLDFTHAINSAMEALRKSHNAFAAANVSLVEAHYGHEGISFVKRVIDFNFHDVEGLLRLVRLAMEAISC
ncbi:cysteine-tryptophan domain-containing zinc finger protein 3-like [Tasmannia lanceolata]|uniref:cysteine-tryptophan domain-containing zinc finger protein 3-like n=1 Tax=Tasmannia lanceolata TaxID=3420 RepID=UPI004064350D